MAISEDLKARFEKVTKEIRETINSLKEDVVEVAKILSILQGVYVPSYVDDSKIKIYTEISRYEEKEILYVNRVSISSNSIKITFTVPKEDYSYYRENERIVIDFDTKISLSSTTFWKTVLGIRTLLDRDNIEKFVAWAEAYLESYIKLLNALKSLKQIKKQIPVERVSRIHALLEELKSRSETSK